MCPRVHLKVLEKRKSISPNGILPSSLNSNITVLRVALRFEMLIGFRYKTTPSVRTLDSVVTAYSVFMVSHISVSKWACRLGALPVKKNPRSLTHNLSALIK